MADGAGGKEDKRAGGKFNDKIKFFKDKVAAELRVVATQSPYSTPTLRNVRRIAMASTAAAGTEIERACRPNAVLERAAAGGVEMVQGFCFGCIVFVHFRGVRMKRRC